MMVPRAVMHVDASVAHEGGLTIYVMLVVGMASQVRRTVPCSWLKPGSG